jgi:hypothetical protein
MARSLDGWIGIAPRAKIMSEEEDFIRSKVFDLLSRAEKESEITVRDDQQEFAALLDAAKICRRQGRRFRLVDSGKFSLFDLEWLAEAGADIYTSDEARTGRTELDLLARACARGNSIVAFFQNGALTEGPEGAPASSDFLLDIGRSGVDLHLTNRERPRDFGHLAGLAHACRRAGSFFVYYHHGRPDAGLEDVIRNGAWIHLSDQSFQAEEDAPLLADLLRQAEAAGAGLVLHIEKGQEMSVLRALFKSGAYVLFKTPPSDSRSPLRALETAAQKRAPGFRTYYLYTTFLP